MGEPRRVFDLQISKGETHGEMEHTQQEQTKAVSPGGHTRVTWHRVSDISEGVIVVALDRFQEAEVCKPNTRCFSQGTRSGREGGNFYHKPTLMWSLLSLLP